MRGTVLAIEGNRYVLRDLSGREHVLSVDEHSRRDSTVPGDEVRVFVTKDGYAAYIQKIEPQPLMAPVPGRTERCVPRAWTHWFS
jgi:hypothetical protein